MATKTYILAPNFTCKPDGPIQIGSIIADPFRPAKSLSNVVTAPTIETVFHHNLEATCETSKSAKLSLWAQILDVAGGGVGTSRVRNAVNSISVERLETRYLAQEPADNDPELISRLKEPRVQAAIKSGFYGHTPVYLVSGVKIARGLVIRSEKNQAAGGSLTVTAPAAQAVGIDVGASLDGENSRGTSSSFEMRDQDVVVAYQLHTIKGKGRSKGRATVDVFESEAAFLHHDVDKVGEEGTEVGTGGIEALAEAARELHVTIETEKILSPDGDLIMCIRARED